MTLDPAAKTPAFTVYAINYSRLQVRVYAVEPSDWSAYRKYIQDYYYQDTVPEPPGRRVMDEIVPLEAAADTLTEASIDLSAALPGSFGHLIVVVEPAPGLRPANRDPYSDRVQAWVQVTDIGLDAFADHSEMVVWTTALEDGEPLSGVSIQTEAGGTTVTTGADGLARFQLPASGVSYLVARLGDDEAILPRSTSVWGEDSWQPRPVRDVLRWYVFDDRQIYRPGEEVHVKGWVRLVGGKQNGDVGLAGDALSAVNYQVYGSQGNEIVSGQTDANALGGFDFAFTVPENANLGEAQILLNAVGSTGGLDGIQSYHPFQVQEFRRPEFEVSARNETTGPYFVGDQAVVAVSANYYAGGPLPNADVTWYVTSSPSSYTPPNWPDFIFGTWTPWWYDFGFYYTAEAYYPFGPESPGSTSETYTGVTDATGNHYLSLDFEEADKPEPFSVVAEATVMDVNRQAWSSTTTMLVHPAEMYVGLRSNSTFVERGTPLEIETIVTDLDGNAIAGRPVQVEAARLEWQFKQGSWSEEPVDVQRCTQQSTLEPVACTFETTIGGEYQITALVTDTSGRLNRSQFTRWVSGGQQPPAREVEQETVTLIPDKEDYQPGDVAQILVQAPFTPAEGLLTVSRSGLLYTERFAMDGNTTTLQVPIEEAHIPNLQVQIDLVGSAPRTDDQGEAVEGLPPRPAYASGSLGLNIPPLSRTLSLQIIPQETELEPGGETTIDVELRDAAGQPVSGAELAVVVVDEAILALSNYQLADPVTAFYELRSGDVSSQYGRASIVLANPEELAEQTRSQTVTVQATRTAESGVVEEALALPAEAPAAEADMAFAEGVGGAPGEAAPIRVRSDFDPLALFAPSVPTDSDGRAQVEVKVPDNLTRYRVMVVAVAGGKAFGMGEANLVARLPLMVRPSAPRFLNFGDQFELPVVLQNQTDTPLLVDVVVEAGNIQLTSEQGQRVSVPARDRVEVRFPATTVQPGTARFQFAAVAEEYADAATVELPVYTPATTEAFATYGVIDEGAIAQPVEAPTGVFPQFGGLEISTSSTALQALTDAVLYLVSYPYECSEQLASRIMAVAALRDVLTAFSAEGLPSPEEMEAAVARDVERLQRLQNSDGGFPYWDHGRESVPFNTIHVAHALERARQKGFDVPADMQQFVLEYLRQIENTYPSWYTRQTRQTLSAYALYVRDLMGDTDQAKARRLLNESGLDDLSLEATAWLWQVLIDDPASTAELEAIRRHVNNQAVETAGAANFVTSYSDDDYVLLGSNRRTDAVVLDALIADQPQNDLIPKVVNGLLAHRTRGRWGNTQENVFVLLALDRYFNTFESQSPDFVARIWLGDTYAGSHAYAGRTTERHETDIPMAYLVDETLGGGETQDLILSKEGTGRLYYRLGLRYAPEDLALGPLDMGFVVQRVYEAVDDPGDVSQDENGVWHIKAGARVRVKLTMVADSRRYHVALVDPLPAGLEIVNPELAVSGDLPQDPGDPVYRYGWWWGPWYEHQNMRDERAEAFTSLLWDGVYDYTYVARATTPGDFVVPPAKAEEMYSPEVFGRSGSDRVIVE
ncbi:MAG: alpha-2-macroglobulin family protein [Candidatus Promineifilaceae bacterium]